MDVHIDRRTIEAVSAEKRIAELGAEIKDLKARMFHRDAQLEKQEAAYDENATLREALKPLVKDADEIKRQVEQGWNGLHAAYAVTYADVLRALAALTTPATADALDRVRKEAKIELLESCELATALAEEVLLKPRAIEVTITRVLAKLAAALRGGK